MADAYVVVRDTIKELHNAVSQFSGEQVTTDHLQIWSCKKIVALHLYIKSYLTIMRSNGFKKIHYADLFSGSGLMKIQDKIMPGTPLVPLIRHNDGLTFDHYFFSDLKTDYTQQLETRAKKLCNLDSSELRIENYDFETAVRHIFGGRWPKFNYKDNSWLVTVDPFGMEVSWESIVRILGSGSVDMILTFMTHGFKRNQNLAQSEQAITRVFGNEEWRGKEDLIGLYRQQIENLQLGNSKNYQTNVIAVENSVGAKYHLVFVSTSDKGGHDSFNWIQEHIDQVDLKLLKDAFRGGTTEGSDLDYYIKPSSK